MDKKLKGYTWAGIVFVWILGSLSHYFYQWSGNNVIVGLFSPVNESTWEHMKLLFFPMLLYSVWMLIQFGAARPCIYSGTLYGILAGTFAIPLLFYTYTGILGGHTLVLDIAVFLVSVLLGFWILYRCTSRCIGSISPAWNAILLGGMTLLFFVFSY